MSVAAVHGADAEAIERARMDSPELDAVLEKVMKSGEVIIRQPGDAMWPAGRAADFPSDYSSLAAPMRVADRAIGLITLAHRERGRYGHEASGMVETFANYAATAIENSRLYDAAQEQAYASAALLQVAQATRPGAGRGSGHRHPAHADPARCIQRSLYGWDAARSVTCRGR
jgi:transcriptional regulator with GAF, ATPase, and Fis domain